MAHMHNLNQFTMKYVHMIQLIEQSTLSEEERKKKERKREREKCECKLVFEFEFELIVESCAVSAGPHRKLV
jgi:hypothetical protein